MNEGVPLKSLRSRLLHIRYEILHYILVENCGDRAKHDLHAQQLHKNRKEGEKPAVRFSHLCVPHVGEERYMEYVTQ